MEILIKNSFYKVIENLPKQRLEFVNLSNLQKIEFEKWFAELAAGNIIKSVDLNILQSGAYPTTAFLIDDSKIYELKGIFPASIGDSSSDFTLSFDFKKNINFDFIDLLKNVTQE